jgi:hypothetical protein
MNFGRFVWQERPRRRGSLPNFQSAQWSVVARVSRRAVRQGRAPSPSTKSKCWTKHAPQSSRHNSVISGSVLNGESKHYVMQLDPEGPSDEQHRRLEGILAFSLNLESGGDVVERNILLLAARQMKRGVELPDEAEREIEATFQAARNNLGATASIFMTGDRAARTLIEQRGTFVAGGRRDPRPSRPVADEQRKAGATSRPVRRRPSSGAQAHY